MSDTEQLYQCTCCREWFPKNFLVYDKGQNDVVCTPICSPYLKIAGGYLAKAGMPICTYVVNNRGISTETQSQ